MIAPGIVLLIVAAGYVGLSLWLVPLAAASLTLASWWDKLLPLLRGPREPWSTKITTYFVTGILANIAFAALGYGAGRIMRIAIG